MSPDRFTHHGPASYGIEANAGVDLRRAGDGQQIVVTPRAHPDSSDPPPEPFPRFPIPALVIEDKARLLRRLAYAGRRGMWALYLDTMPPHGWHFYLPPQWGSPVGVRANLSYPQVEVPRPQLRLAGTFQSAPLAKPDDLVPLLSPVDGVHIIMHPAEGWMLMTAFLIIDGESYPVLPHRLIADPFDPQMLALADRLRVDESAL